MWLALGDSEHNIPVVWLGLSLKSSLWLWSQTQVQILALLLRLQLCKYISMYTYISREKTLHCK